MKKNISGFTVVELLIVIIMIAILATISIAVYSGVQERARVSKMQNDIATLTKATLAATSITEQPLGVILGAYAPSCGYKDSGTDLTNIRRDYRCMLDAIRHLAPDPIKYQ